MDLLAGLLVTLGVVVALWAAGVLVIWLHRPSRELARPALELLPSVVVLVRRLLADRSTPRSARIALAFLALWIVSPIDLVPEFLPGLGPLDDIVVAALVLRWAGRRIGRDRLRVHWPGSPESFQLLERLL
ncbi:MAG TPA: DUF1232 domain-containing protein [Candidatus Limnocylindrales bacterium]|nr:DUF1232 domain-containing protein [Candidatus Limnocylindrales bacterium]